MSFKLAGLAAPLSWSDGVQATSAVLVCTGAFALYTVSRLLAAHATDVSLHLAASSPAEAVALGVLALWLVCYSAGYSRLLQLLPQLRTLTAVLALSTSARVEPPAAPAPLAKPSSTVAATSPAAPPSPSGSPQKEIAAHRLAELRRGRSAKHKHRWSFDVAPSSGPRRDVPRPRATSLDRPASSSPSKARAAGEAGPQQPARRSAEPAAPAATSSARGRRHRQPPMQRIASGQQLVELCGTSRRSIENTRPPPAVAGPLPPACAETFLPSNILSMAVPVPSAFLGSAVEPASAPQPETAAAAVAPSPAAAAEPESAAPAPLPAPASAPPPSSPTKAALAMTSWVFSRTVAPISTWASTTVDSVLRPLIPGGSKPAADGPPERLQRAQSAPLPQVGHTLREGAPGVRPVLSADQRRRVSLDGGGHSYTHGGIEADPARVGRLEQYARAARLQACSSSAVCLAHCGGGSHPASPGHVSLASEGLAPLGAAAGRSAVASVGLDGDCAQEIRALVTDEHLLQFGALLGEEAAQQASADLGVCAPWGSEESLFGAVDAKGCASDPEWEQIVNESTPGMRYKAWRRPLRGGLYVYRASALFAGISPQELRAFHLDDDIRPRWDETVMEIERVQPPGAARLPARATEWCFHRFRSRFPRPMAARVYNYARRVWHRPADGGCYVVCRVAKLPPAECAARAVQVGEFVSCTTIRAAKGGAELATAYFEDSQVRPGLAKVAVPKGLFPFMAKYEAALRSCLDLPEAAAAAGRRGRGRTSLDGGGGEGASFPGAGGRRAAWRLGRTTGASAARMRGGAPTPAARSKLVRNVVLATSIKVLFDIMRR